MAFTTVQSPAPATVNDTAAVGLAWPVATTAGATLVAVHGRNENAGDVTDTPPAGWGTAKVDDNRTTDVRLFVYVIENAGSRSGTETFTASAARDGTLHLFEMSGGVLVSVVDQNAANANGNSATPTTATTGTTAQADERLIAITVNKNVETEISPTNSFVALGTGAHSSNATAGKQLGTYCWVRDVTATGTYSMGTSNSPATVRPWVANLLTFKAAPIIPTVTQSAATAVTSSAATLNGTVDPKNDPATWVFKYGTAIGGPYPNSSAGGGPIAAFAGSTPVSDGISGLAPSTTHYAVLQATNAAGTATSSEISFTTSAAPASPGPAGAGTSDVVLPALHLERHHHRHREQIRWVIDGRTYDVADDWEATEVANGGFETATLTVPWRYQRRFAQGDEVWAYRRNGEVIFFGELDTDPAMVEDPERSGEKAATLKAVGPQSWIRSSDGRLPYQIRGYDQWVPADSEPHNYSTNVKFDTDAAVARLLYKAPAAENFAINNQAGFVLWVPGFEVVSVAWTIRKNADDANFDLILQYADGPAGGMTDEQNYALGAGNPDGTPKNRNMVNFHDQIQMAVRATVAGAPAATRKFWLTDVAVNVLAPAGADEMSPSQILADVFARVGYKPDVAPSGRNALPEDWTGGTWDGLADKMCMFDDWRWRVDAPARRRGAPIGTAGPWGDDDEEWKIFPSWQNRLLDPLPRYNVVVVRWTTVTGIVREEVSRAKPDPLRGRRDRILFVEISGDAKPSADLANAIGSALIERVSQPRLVGDIPVKHAHRFGRGHDRSPYQLRAGGIVHIGSLPDLPEQRILAVSKKKNEDVSITIGDRVEEALMDRFLVRAAANQARRV